MRPEHALAGRKACRDAADRDDGRVTGEQRRPRRVAFEGGEDLSLHGKALGRGFDDDVGVGDGRCQVGKRRDARQRGRVLTHVGEDRADSLLQRSEARGVRVVNGDVMAGDGEDLGDAMAHQPSADDGDLGAGRHGELGARPASPPTPVIPAKAGTQ